MIDADSNLESFKCRNFNANEALGSEVVDRKYMLKVVDIELYLSFSAKEISEVEIGSGRGGRALGFGVLRSEWLEFS